jgi:glycerol-3-phosphate acyltransferase PlsY
MIAALILVAAYLLGSLPFSFLVARAFGVRDVREVGSGNVGATNVARSAGRGAGAVALVLDAGKGAAATLLAMKLDPDSKEVMALAAAAAVLGHMYPLWLRFRGGKGVATGLGAFAPLAPTAAVGATALFLVATATTGFVSVGSMVGAASLAGLVFFLDGVGPVAWTATATAVLVLWRHRSNLRRLWTGQEHRAGGSGEVTR